MATPKETGVLANEPKPDILPSPPSEDSSSQKTADNNKDTEPFNPGWRFIAAFASMCVIVLMSALDATSLSVALPVSPLPPPLPPHTHH